MHVKSLHAKSIFTHQSFIIKNVQNNVYKMKHDGFSLKLYFFQVKCIINDLHTDDTVLSRLKQENVMV